MKKKYLMLFFVLIFFFPIFPKGNWEVGSHYSYWTIDMISSFVEENLTPDIEYYDPSKASLDFTSEGNNYGFEVRFFPAGENGSFSIGVSYERNNFKARVDGLYKDKDDGGNDYTATAYGTLDLVPHSFNFSIRWELWPKSRIHPYIGFGFGLGKQTGSLTIHSKLVTNIDGYDVVDETDESWTFDDLKDEYKKEEGKDFPVSFFPIVHLNFGFRGKIINNVYLLAEVAVYDGLIFRGGIAYRF